MEGYGHASLPSHPGHHTLTLDTWRPVGSSPAAEMKRFFIGGTPELEDIRYVGSGAGQGEGGGGGVVSKLGFQTRAAGRVVVRLEAVHQAKAFMLGCTRPQQQPQGTARRLARRTLMDRLSSATLFTSVNTVLEAFRKAREKIVKATEGLESENAKNLGGEERSALSVV